MIIIFTQSYILIAKMLYLTFSWLLAYLKLAKPVEKHCVIPTNSGRFSRNMMKYLNLKHLPSSNMILGTFFILLFGSSSSLY